MSEQPTEAEFFGKEDKLMEMTIQESLKANPMLAPRERLVKEYRAQAEKIAELETELAKPKYGKSALEPLAMEILHAKAAEAALEKERIQHDTFSKDIDGVIKDLNEEINRLKAACAEKDDWMKMVVQEINEKDPAAEIEWLENILFYSIKSNTSDGSEILKQLEAADSLTVYVGALLDMMNNDEIKHFSRGDTYQLLLKAYENYESERGRK